MWDGTPFTPERRRFALNTVYNSKVGESTGRFDAGQLTKENDESDRVEGTTVNEKEIVLRARARPRVIRRSHRTCQTPRMWETTESNVNGALRPRQTSTRERSAVIRNNERHRVAVRVPPLTRRNFVDVGHGRRKRRRRRRQKRRVNNRQRPNPTL